MAKISHENALLARRKKRIRKNIRGTALRPRVTVFRSLNHIYAQVIDDDKGVTVASASSVAMKIAGGSIAGAKEVGKALAQSAKDKGITKVCFDRNGRLFHGRVKALADAAREAGLEF